MGSTSRTGWTVAAASDAGRLREDRARHLLRSTFALLDLHTKVFNPKAYRVLRARAYGPSPPAATPPRSSSRGRPARRTRTGNRQRAPGREPDDPPEPEHTPPGSRAKPNLADVLAQVQPGNTAPLALTADQKQAFRDRDGRIGLDVLRHLLGARASINNGTTTGAFPLTAAAFQAVARKLGHRIGMKRSYALIRRLRSNILGSPSYYRQPYRNLAGSSGYLVSLYRLAVLASPPKKQRAVGSGSCVKAEKKPPWWKHELFGDPTGRPPPGLSAAQRRRMKSGDQRERHSGYWRARRMVCLAL